MALTDSDTLNYRGELFESGRKKTPFLNLIAGKAKRASSFLFPMGQTWSLAAASQPSITEDASVGSLTPTTTTRTEVTNTAQIFLNTVSVSLKKQSTPGFMSGINTNDPNPVTSELDFQKMVQLRQMALDMEYSFFNGIYANATSSAVAATTRGIVTGTTTNAIAAAGAGLTRAMLDYLLRTMDDSGAPFEDPVIFVRGFQKQMLSRIYEYAPTSRTVGGANIGTIVTDFGDFGVVLCSQLPTDTLLIADLAACAPVFVPVVPAPDGGFQMSMDGADVLWQPTAITNASYGGYFYSQAGLDYGVETYHGKITGLATA